MKAAVTQAAIEQQTPAAELSLRLLRYLVRYLTDHYSPAEIANIASSAGLAAADFTNCASWVTLEQFEELLARARALMPDDATFLEACAYMPNSVPGPLRLLVAAVSPMAGYQVGARRMHLVTQISHFEPVVLSSTRLQLSYHTTKRESRLMCLSRLAQIRAVPRLWGLPLAHVEEHACVARGDDCCLYDVRLHRTRRWSSVVLGAALGSTVGLCLQAWIGATEWWWCSLIGATLGHLFERHRVATINARAQAEVTASFFDLARSEAHAQRELFELTHSQKMPIAARVAAFRDTGESTVSLPGPSTSEKPRCPSENSVLARAAGTLNPSEARLVDDHVDICSACRWQLAEAACDSSRPRPERPDSATFSAGELVADRYTIRRRIAKGGMGEVYEAHDGWIDAVIALKTIVPAIADNDRALARLKAETRLARQVTHENVCRVFDLGFHQRRGEPLAYLTMEYLPGSTLRQRVRQIGPLAFDHARCVVQQMIAALSHAHSAGIVHRDFKSDNVMLVDANDSTPERVVVTDFGLALLVADSEPITSKSNRVLGTLDYMSPEQVVGRPATAASDIYALGVVIFELLTGRLPFEAETPLARALQRVTDPPLPISSILPGLDPSWSRAIERCLQLDPSDRFPSLEALSQALSHPENG